MTKLSPNVSTLPPQIAGMPTTVPTSKTDASTGTHPASMGSRASVASNHQFEQHNPTGTPVSTTSHEVLRDLGGQQTSLAGEGQMQSGIRQRGAVAGAFSSALHAVRDGLSYLQQGMQGETVSQLQQLLNKTGASLQVDGQFGPATLQAVRNFQQTHGLKMDGLVGAQTLRALEGGTTVPTQSTASSTSPTPASQTSSPNTSATPTSTIPTSVPSTATGTSSSTGPSPAVTATTGVNPTTTGPVGQRIVSEALAEDGKVSNTAYDGAEYQGWQHLQDTIAQATRGPLGADGKHHPPGIRYTDSNIRTHPRPIWTDNKGKVHHMDWCGVWATRMFQKAGVNCHWEPGTGVKGDVNKVFSPKPEDIKPGDMIVGPGPLWHHAIVTDIRRDATGKPVAFETMNGNHPGIGSGSMPAGNVQAYYRPKEA